MCCQTLPNLKVEWDNLQIVWEVLGVDIDELTIHIKWQGVRITVYKESFL